jgi:Protein of unknown function (DUF2846)
MKTLVLLGMMLVFVNSITAQSNVNENGKSEQKALVYFIRSGAKGGIVFTTTCNNELVGLTRGSDYLYKQVDPGRIEIMTAGGLSHGLLSLEVERGKVYFVRIYNGAGLWLPKTGMKLMDDSWGRKRLGKFSLGTMNIKTEVAVNLTH